MTRFEQDVDSENEKGGKPVYNVSVSECVDLTRVPEQAAQESLLEGYNDLMKLLQKADPNFEKLRIMTSKGRIGDYAETGVRVERPRSLRAKRAELGPKLMEHRHDDMGKEIIRELNARDEIAYDYLRNQRVVEVESDEYGVVSSRCLIIDPPDSCRTPEKDALPPVVLIGGWGADVAGMESAIQEIAYQGRKVIFISHPDSQFGYMDDKFVGSVMMSQDLTPHADYFKQAAQKLVDQFVGQGENFELWGLSAGAMVSATMLMDNEFSSRVENAVLVAPAGSSSMNLVEQASGYAAELKGLFEAKQKIAYYSYVMGRADPTGHNFTPEELKRQSYHRVKNVWPKIVEFARSRLPAYDEARVQVGGKILVVSGDKDATVSSKERFGEENHVSNPQMTVLSGKNWGHGDIIYNPEDTVQTINRALHPSEYQA